MRTVSLLAALFIAGSAAAQVPNDSCSSPEAAAGYGAFPFSTVGATNDSIGQTGCAAGQLYNDVWFCWTAAESGVVEASVCGTATFDTVMAVYAGCGCPAAGSALACNDDSCACASGCTGNYASRVQWVASAGSTYMIRVGGYGATGSGSGAVAVAAVPPLADVVNPANEHRYIAVNATSWSAAEAFAVQLGAHLVSIESADENLFVQQNFGNLLGSDRRIWIGLNDLTSEGKFEWSDGTVVGFTAWNGGEPNNSGGIEDAVEMFGSTGVWNDIQDSGGTYAHIAVIEFSDSEPPPPPSCPSDLSGDGFVTGADLGVLLGDWGQFGTASDLDGDGFVSGSDLGILLGDWGPCT